MIHLGLLFFLGGTACAAMRSRVRNDTDSPVNLPALNHVEAKNEHSGPPQFDDVGELKHYQKVSLYALAFTSSGWFFYPSVSILAAPLLGYNAYNILRSLSHSHQQRQRSALTVFELIGIGATLLTGKFMTTSILMLFAFSRRNLLLQAGNISNNMAASEALNYSHNSFWVLREGVEIEVFGSELQDSDIVVFHSGDIISIEGVVIEGEGKVRQSGLNNKMKLVSKLIGDKVYPYTRLQQGCLHIAQ